MSERITYDLADGVATIAMDDGKVNALSSAMTAEISAALTQAQHDDAVVVLTSRARAFSAGFDLRSDDWQTMVGDGARLAAQMLSFPRPIVVSCPASAIAMGGFLLLAGDHRIGVTGEHRIGLNEVAIGMTVPWFGIELARHRLTAPAFDRCMITGALLEPEEALVAGFLDRLVAPDELATATAQAAAAMTELDAKAHAATKLRVRAGVLEAVRAGAERIAGDPQGQDW